jgi:hypothetical protein
MARLFTFASLLTAVALTSIGCVNGVDGDGTNQPGTQTENPDNPTPVKPGEDQTNTAAGTPCPGQGIKVLGTCNAKKGEYVALQGSDKDRIANEMWTVMTNAPCWYKDNSVAQYVFYGNLQYTHWGEHSDSKAGGTLGVESVGRFEDKNASIIILRSEQWLLVTLDAQTLTLGKYINGQPHIELYRAQMDGRCT